MKFSRLLALVLLAPSLVGFMTGCATRRPMLSAWRDSQSAPTRASKIALTLQLNPSAEDVELGRLLRAELKREGFNVVPAAQADYLMAYKLEDELVPNGNHWVTTTTPASPPQTTAQMMGGQSLGGPSANSTIPGAADVQPVVFRNRGIRLFLYSNPKSHPGGFQIVWQGYIASGQTTSAQRETALIRTLLGYMGKEQHGPVDLVR